MYKLKIFILVLLAIKTNDGRYVIPDITIQALTPKGLIVTIPDTSGIQQFAFHANINQEIRGKEDGTISKEIGFSQNGVWKIKDPDIQLKIGDVLNYWAFVQYDRFGYDKQDQNYTVRELVAEDIVDSGTAPCKQSATTINGGQSVCGGTKIFEDTFDSIDDNKWIREQYVPWGPDFEFNTYEKHPENTFIMNGELHLKSTIRENPMISTVDLTEGCTGANCSISLVGTINPPIIGAKVKSKFSFKFGRVEIRARLPTGDWIFPQLYLEPQDHAYGTGYNSGRMWLAYARGNQDLKTADRGMQIGNTVLYCGPVLDVEDPQRTYKVKEFKSTASPWGKSFHTYALDWRPDGIFVSVDNKNHQTILPRFSIADGPNAQNWESTMAPFDKDFVITLGIGVAGHSDFPEGCTSNGVKKPWKKKQAKAILNFFKQKDLWYPSWESYRSELKIDYIRVWAL